MTDPLLSSADLASLIALPLSAVAILRRRTDGWLYASVASLGPVYTLAFGGGMGLISAAFFRRGFLQGAPDSLDVIGMTSAFRDYYAELEPAARMALRSGGMALCAVVLAAGVIARSASGARCWVGLALSGVALSLFFVTWRVSHMSNGAQLDAIDVGVKFALAHGTESCESLERVFDAANRAGLSLERERPRARELARACVDQKIAHLDDAASKNYARTLASMRRALGEPPIPETPAAQLLVTCALPMDRTQRAEVERRAAAEP